MYIGIDLGTSGVKAILLSEQGDVLATQTEKLQVSRPHPLWSEQDPEQWWLATDRAIKALGEQHSLRDVKPSALPGKCTARRYWTVSITFCDRPFSGTMVAVRKSAHSLKSEYPPPAVLPAT